MCLCVCLCVCVCVCVCVCLEVTFNSVKEATAIEAPQLNGALGANNDAEEGEKDKRLIEKESRGRRNRM